jgi:hypothetical protein
MSAKLLVLFAKGWVLLFGLLVVISVGRHVMLQASSVGQGLEDVKGWFDPASARTYAIPAILLSPALAAFLLSLRLRRLKTG